MLHQDFVSENEFEQIKALADAQEMIESEIVKIAYDKRNIKKREKELQIRMDQLEENRHQVLSKIQERYGKIAVDLDSGMIMPIDENTQ